MKTIPCTNPDCDSVVPIALDAEYAVCPSCNAWHFISDDDRREAGGLPAMESPDAPLPFSPEPEGAAQAGLPAYELYPSSFGHTEAGKFVNTQEINSTSPGAVVLETGERFPLKEGMNIIGRSNCDITIPERSVSRRHCIVEVIPKAEAEGWDYFLFDIGHIEATASSNGVFVAGRSLRLHNYERIPIRKGMEIQLGRIKLTLDI